MLKIYRIISNLTGLVNPIEIDTFNLILVLLTKLANLALPN